MKVIYYITQVPGGYKLYRFERSIGSTVVANAYVMETALSYAPKGAEVLDMRAKPASQIYSLLVEHLREKAKRNPPRRRRGRNSPYGTSAGEYRHAGWNPKRRRTTATKPRSMGRRPIQGAGHGAILLGHLTEVVLNDGRALNTSALRGLYVAWLPSRKDLVIVRKVKARPGRVDSEALRRHRKFHGQAPNKAATYDLPERQGQLREVGLIESLTYVVPPDVNSPEKANISWYHKFGDHGESGHGSVEEGADVKYPTKYMPAMCEDAAGNLTIKRRPGNKFTVTDWIFW